jgi:fatty acid desaturase
MPPSNEACELLNQLYELNLQRERGAAAPELDPALASRPAPVDNASAIRGLIFGLPLALIIWAIPTVAWLVTGNPWVGAATCVVMFAAAGLVIWWPGRRRAR